MLDDFTDWWEISLIWNDWSLLARYLKIDVTVLKE
jgi:hypothetical protein